MQAVDRCFRAGQTRKVFAYKLITKGTVEEKVLELQERKKARGKNLITAENGIFKNLRKDEILDLFGGDIPKKGTRKWLAISNFFPTNRKRI
jgi:non-specific serine/threonine protein kinase